MCWVRGQSAHSTWHNSSNQITPPCYFQKVIFVIVSTWQDLSLLNQNREISFQNMFCEEEKKCWSCCFILDWMLSNLTNKKELDESCGSWQHEHILVATDHANITLLTYMLSRKTRSSSNRKNEKETSLHTCVFIQFVRMWMWIVLPL